MTTPNPQPTQMEQRMEASPDLFMSGEVPEPLDAEQRDWLVRQLIAYPDRVDPERTCAIGALQDMATAEFCRMQSRPTADLGDDGEVTRPDPEMTSDRISGFLSAIMEHTPNGEYIAVQYHPNGDWTVAAEASGLLSLQRERDELRALIRECRLADAHAARTGEEGRFDRAFHALCGAERAALTHVENEEREG